MTRSGIDTRELNAFVDGELDLRRQLDIEALLRQDERLRGEVATLRALHDAVRTQGDYHAMPAALKQRLHAVAGQGASSAATPQPVRASRRSARHVWLAWQPFALSFACAALLALGAGQWWIASQRDSRLVQEAIASHVRATLSQRLVDVASSDQHTVKPWLSARLDYSPPVHELPGTVFLGGRVDYLDGRPTAALVYRQRAHVIDVFIAPASPGDEAMQWATQRGFNVVQQQRGGMHYWVVSDLNAQELRAFVQAFDAADAVR